MRRDLRAPAVHDDMADTEKRELPRLGEYSESICSVNRRTNYGIGGAYCVFALCVFVVIHEFSAREFSGVLTLGSGVQTLGFLALLLKVRAQKSVKGVSSKTMEIYALVLCARLCSTLVKHGYLPQDRTGDGIYQLADIMSLLIVLQILFLIHKVHNNTFQEQQDALEIWRAVPPLGLLAFFVHGDLNNSPFFDIVWTISMNLDTIALMPQLFMLTKIGGEVEGMTSHFVFALIVSRALTFAFWLYGYEELAPKSGGVNVAGYYILGAHTIQLLMSADFLAHYGKARCTGRRMTLPSLEEGF